MTPETKIKIEIDISVYTEITHALKRRIDYCCTQRVKYDDVYEKDLYWNVQCDAAQHAYSEVEAAYRSFLSGRLT